MYRTSSNHTHTPTPPPTPPPPPPPPPPPTHTHKTPRKIGGRYLEVGVAREAEDEALEEVEGDGEVLQERGEDYGGQVRGEERRGPRGDQALGWIDWWW